MLPHQPPPDLGARWRESSAFAETYARYWSDVCGYVRRRFGLGPPDPEDVAQIAFVRMGELPQSKAIDNPRAFLFQMAANVAIDAHRQQVSQSGQFVATQTELSPAEDAQTNAERALVGRQTLTFLEEVVRGMPERHRSYLLANRLDGLTYAEISRRTGASQSLVRKTVEEALAVCERSLASGSADYRGLSRERRS
jgi:RNA polymerase sigma-70 factor (ECF subfamily)